MDTLSAEPASEPLARPQGLDEQMARVLRCHKAARDKLSGKNVHQLRVALRSCLSLGDGLREFDDHIAWSTLREQGRRLFKRVGMLRDIHVLEARVKKLSAVRDSVSRRLLRLLAERLQGAQRDARQAVAAFNRKAWRRLASLLPRRSARLAMDDLAFEQLALQRWTEAEDLHYKALEGRSREGYHELRIAIKRFRYTVAAFLPGFHARWGRDLRRLQSLLGQVHDLDLVDDLLKAAPGLSRGARKRWRQHIEKEIQDRLQRYRKLTMGERSLWSAWRAGLPGDSRLQESAVARLAAWATFHDRDYEHTAHVARLALQLFDALRAARLREPFSEEKARHKLEAAVFLHNVAARAGKPHKEAARVVRALPAPLGWSRFEMDYVADIVRYHRGKEPQARHRRFGSRPPEQQQAIRVLAGLLRLAVALDAARTGAVKGLSLEVSPEAVIVRAEGFDETGPSAAAVSEGKALLEAALDRLVLVKSAEFTAAPARHTEEE